jgi:hypothetical protein
VKATISIPKMAAFSTNAVTKDDVDADLAVWTSDLPIISVCKHMVSTDLHGGRTEQRTCTSCVQGTSSSN